MTAKRLLAAAAGGVLALGAVAGAAYAAASAFSDVGDDHEHAAEIAAAHQIGVFNGYGDGTFRPDGKLTQAQAENVIWRMLSWHGTDDDGNFEITRADAAALAMTGLCGLDPDRIPGCAEIAPQAAEEPRASRASGPDTAAPETSTPSTPSYSGPVAECPSSYHGSPMSHSAGTAKYEGFYGGHEAGTGDPWCVHRLVWAGRDDFNRIHSTMRDSAWCQTDSTDILETITKTKTVEQSYSIIRGYHIRVRSWPIAGEAVEIAAKYINPSVNIYRGPEVQELVQELRTALGDARSAVFAPEPPARLLRWLGSTEDIAAACFDALRQ